MNTTPSPEEAEKIQTGIIEELEKPAEDLLNRHLAASKPWYPHKYVPWGQASKIKPHEAWDPNIYPLDDSIRSALYVNLLTEDNLPYYTHTILNMTPEDHPLSTWSRRWTAEEDRHAEVIRSWITVTQALDPIKLEDGRMAQESLGKVPQPPSLTDMIAYVSFQELATNIAHRNTGLKLGKDLMGSLVMAVVSGDELKHHNFYRDLTKTALEIDPSTVVVSIARQLKGFKMPGTGIPDFKEHQAAISLGGIFGITELLNDVITPTIEAWNINTLEGLSPIAEKARMVIDKRITRLGKYALEEQEARAAA